MPAGAGNTAPVRPEDVITISDIEVRLAAQKCRASSKTDIARCYRRCYIRPDGDRGHACG